MSRDLATERRNDALQVLALHKALGLAACGCSPADADHYVQHFGTTYPDTGDTRVECACRTCGTVWTEETRRPELVLLPANLLEAAPDVAPEEDAL